jgi:hypothetical protein
MSLTMRKVVVLGLIGVIFLAANILVVANWIAKVGIAEKAGWLRQEFLTGTAVTIIVVLLILLVSPKAGALVRRCPVCDHVLLSRGKYCGECGSKV